MWCPVYIDLLATKCMHLSLSVVRKPAPIKQFGPPPIVSMFKRSIDRAHGQQVELVNKSWHYERWSSLAENPWKIVVATLRDLL